MRSTRVLFAIDVLIVLFLAAAILIQLTGGFYSEPFGLRVSARRPDRPLFVALAFVLIRWKWLTSGGFLGVAAGAYRRTWHRWYGRNADDAPRDRTSVWQTVAVAAGLVLMSALMLNEQLRSMTSVSDLGDPLFSMWRLGWVHQQIQGDPRALFDANIFHPMPLTLAMSESMLLPGLVAHPLFSAGLHPLHIYNGLLLAGFPLTGLATYFLLRKLTGSAAASFVGALFYMQHPYKLEHYSHFEQGLIMWMPVTLLALVHFVETSKLRYAIAAALGAVGQLYSSMYLAVYFPFYAVVVIGVLVLAWGRSWKRLVWPGLVAAVLAIGLAVPLARPYLAAEPLKGERHTFEVEFYSANVTDYLRPHPRLAVHKGRWLENRHPERALFPGVTSVALSAAALAPPVGPIRLAFTAGLAAALELSHGMKGTLYPLLYKYFPPIRGMRVPARFSVILGLSLAVLAAFGVRRLMARLQPGWRRRAAFAGIAAVMAVDLWPAVGLHPVWTDVPRIYEDVRDRPDVVLAEFPFELNPQLLRVVTNEVPFQYFSLWHWRQIVNGLSAFTPDGHKALVELMRTFPDPASIAALRTRGVTHVSVNCFLIGDPCRHLMDALDGRPEFTLVRIAHWQMKPTRLYEFVK